MKNFFGKLTNFAKSISDEGARTHLETRLQDGPTAAKRLDAAGNTRSFSENQGNVCNTGNSSEIVRKNARLDSTSMSHIEVHRPVTKVTGPTFDCPSTVTVVTHWKNRLRNAELDTKSHINNDLTTTSPSLLVLPKENTELDRGPLSIVEANPTSFDIDQINSQLNTVAAAYFELYRVSINLGLPANGAATQARSLILDALDDVANMQ